MVVELGLVAVLLGFVEAWVLVELVCFVEDTLVLVLALLVVDVVARLVELDLVETDTRVLDVVLLLEVLADESVVFVKVKLLELGLVGEEFLIVVLLCLVGIPRLDVVDVLRVVEELFFDVEVAGFGKPRGEVEVILKEVELTEAFTVGVSVEETRKVVILTTHLALQIQK